MRGHGFGLSQEFSGYNTSSNFNESQAGGFMGSQAGGLSESKAPRASRNLLPVTIKQLLMASSSDAQDTKFKIDDKEFSQCKVVGQIMSRAEQATTVSFVVDDGTGSIVVKMFVSNDEEEARNQLSLTEYSYVRIFGKLVEFQGKRSVSCHAMHLITDFNEITRHRLEAIYAHLVNTRGIIGNSAASQSVALTGSQGFGMNMGMGMSTGMGMSMGMTSSKPSMGMQVSASSTGNMMTVDHGFDFTPLQNMVYNVLHSVKNNSKGITIMEMCQVLPGLNRMQVEDALNFLSNEGHVFNTIDDEHFRIAE